VSYSKKFADKDYVGISINAWGASHEVEMQGVKYNVVDDLTEVQSADIVTKAGAGGRILGIGLREAIKALMREGNPKGGTQPMKDMLLKHAEGLKGLHEEISKTPDHAKLYGPALEELMKHHEAIRKTHEEAEKAREEAAKKAGEEAGKAKPKEDVHVTIPPGSDVAKPGDEGLTAESFKSLAAKYKDGKLTETEKVLFETLLQERAARQIKEHVDMVEKHLTESGLPELYRDDLRVLCAGRGEAEVKKLVEGRESLVSTITGNRASGAGAGAGKGSAEAKTMDAMVKAGVPMKK
jgi:hypothetical protein